MKILFLDDERWDSGLTAYCLQAAALFSRNGHHVVVGVRPGSKPERQARADGLQTLAAATWPDIIRAVRSEPWDVVNAHTGRTHTMAVLARLLTRGRFAVVRTRGDARPLGSRPLSGWRYRQTDGIVAVSDHIRRQYEEKFSFPDGCLTTIYPAVDVDGSPAPLPANVAGILGRLDAVKGHTVFLEAAAKVVSRHPDARFRIAGKPEGVSIDILRNHARQLGIENHVEFLGFVDSARDFIRSCTVGVIASLGSEEVSRACLEWMAGGRPVVGTLVGSVAELVEPRETGALVSPGDSEALADAILMVLADRDCAERLGRAARDHAAVHFSDQRLFERTLALFEAARRRRSPA